MNCSDNHLPLKQHLDNMLRKSGVLNGLPIVEVANGTHTENALSCGLETNHLSFDDLMRKSIGVDACGKPALRVKYIASCTYRKDCNKNDVNDNFNSMFAYDSTLKTFALVLNKSV